MRQCFSCCRDVVGPDDPFCRPAPTALFHWPHYKFLPVVAKPHDFFFSCRVWKLCLASNFWSTFFRRKNPQLSNWYRALMAALTEADIERLLSEAEARLAVNESSNKAVTIVAPASKANALASVATPSPASGEPSKAEKLTMRVPQVQKKDKVCRYPFISLPPCHMMKIYPNFT